MYLPVIEVTDFSFNLRRRAGMDYFITNDQRPWKCSSSEHSGATEAIRCDFLVDDGKVGDRSYRKRLCGKRVRPKG